ncbi:MAG: tRNA (cytosine(32)/uridine(32)-2'-O)-methyltransferase TrmJ [Gammaproteobacteria bacterium]
MLSNIRIVLVNTSHPGNIGAVARAMKTMCLEQLYLVGPKVYPSAEATARASGADDLLARARVCATLDEALAGCTLVAGTSARSRAIPWPLMGPRACAARLAERSESGPVALVFGREQSGLSNEELDRCQLLVQIPSNPEYGSLNLAAAVQVMAYELLQAHRDGTRESDEAPAEHPPATADELDGFYRHLEQTLVALEFLDPANPRHLMRRLRRVYHRAALDRNEVNILRGILTAIQHKTDSG